MVESSWKSNVTTLLHAESVLGSSKVGHAWRDPWKESGNVPHPELDLFVAGSDAAVVAWPCCRIVYMWSKNASSMTPPMATWCWWLQNEVPQWTLLKAGKVHLSSGSSHILLVSGWMDVHPHLLGKHGGTSGSVWDLWTIPSWHAQYCIHAAVGLWCLPTCWSLVMVIEFRMTRACGGAWVCALSLDWDLLESVALQRPALPSLWSRSSWSSALGGLGNDMRRCLGPVDTSHSECPLLSPKCLHP